jgi:hypothetical protein
MSLDGTSGASAAVFQTMVWRAGHLVALVALGVVASTSVAATDPRVFRGSGIVLQMPIGWHVTNIPLNGITNPVQRFVLSSYRRRQTGLRRQLRSAPAWCGRSGP